MNKYLTNILRPVLLAVTMIVPAACGDDGAIDYKGVDIEPSTIDMVQTGLWNQEYIEVEFTPSENSTSFVYTIGKESDREDFIAGGMETNRSEGNETRVIRFEGLDADQEYVIFAVALDQNGVRGPLSSMLTNTYDAGITTELQFAGPTSLGYSFKASLVYRAFEYALVNTLDDIAKFEKELDYDADISGLVKTGGDYANKTLLMDPVYKFTGTYFELTPETKYYVLYRARDRFSGEWTETSVREVETTSKEEYPYVEVTMEYVDYFYSRATFTPNDHVLDYYVYTATPNPFGGMLSHGAYAGDYLGMMKATTSSYIEYTGERTDNFGLDFIQDFTMCFYIAVTDFDGEFVSVQFEPYKTPAFDPQAGQAQIEILSVEVVPGKITATVNPNEETLMFFVELFDESGLREYGLETDADFTGFFQSYYLRNHSRMAHRYMSNGSWWKTVWEEEYSVEDFPAGTQLTVVAAPMNVNGLNGWGNVAKQTVTLP